jgi:hypothetical protein
MIDSTDNTLTKAAAIIGSLFKNADNIEAVQGEIEREKRRQKKPVPDDKVLRIVRSRLQRSFGQSEEERLAKLRIVNSYEAVVKPSVSSIRSLMSL